MATTYLSRTFTASATGEQQWTLSMWVKRTGISATQYLFNAYSDTNNYTGLYFDSTDKLAFASITGGSDTGNLTTNRLFRDTSGFYNIVAVWDSNNGTPGDRMKLYVNGVEETSFATDTNPSSGQDSFVGDSGKNCLLGYKGETGFYFDGLMTHVQLVDSAALAPTEFGQVDATSGIWTIKTACYATPGDNGFCLQMETTTGSAMGTDSSGEGNNLAESGSPTQTVDNPSNVMCTLNPNYQSTFHATSRAVLANGNTKWTGTSDSTSQNGILSTLGASKGKFYLEAKWVGTNDATIGVAKDNFGMMTAGTGGLQSAGWYGMNTNIGATGGAGMAWYTNNVATGDRGSTISTGNIIMMAIDIDNNKLYFGLNGTWEESGDPTSGATGTGATSTLASDTTYLVACANYGYSTANSFEFNFGNGYFGTTIISSAGTSSTDDDSIWEYDCPTGYYGLNTKNINTYG